MLKTEELVFWSIKYLLLFEIGHKMVELTLETYPVGQTGSSVGQTDSSQWATQAAPNGPEK